MSRLVQVRARRERLIAKSAAQRDELALLIAPLRRPARTIDHAVAGAQYLRAHPGVVVIAVAALVVLSPKRAFRWARRAFGLWRGYRLVARMLAQVAA